jgi:alanyl-tRNA synthetase
MKAQEIREEFFNFFKTKQHLIVPSAPLVIKDDPSLMFTNAGMNQFKDIFLGNKTPQNKRVANSQKCLRVSGKHNDLEEVGHDTYHHTMFEMLGNWSFGDYFKKEAIEWAWEFLTKNLGVPEDRLYVTIFEGSKEENVSRDDEAASYWKKCFTNIENRIIEGNKKDNFWEMGETGPCGPCSEIHVDIRDEKERKVTPGHLLVNKGHPNVIEIWNLVFIQYNRKANGALEILPSRHVDTGMGFERLCMVVQGKTSNYDTDVFQPLISEISVITGKPYGENDKWDIAMRVIADHLRAVSFSIADGQIPTNNKSGYVIRRILRRAVRYGYNNLGMEEPFIYKLVPVLEETMGYHFNELITGADQIKKIIYEEESAFLRTLGKGLKMIEKIIADSDKSNNLEFSGKVAFELYDTFGFPLDLTQLILRENNMSLNTKEFDIEMKNQKDRSREDASVESGDWIIIKEFDGTKFTGYEKINDDIVITQYRKVKVKGKDTYQIVFDKTPFYALSGGQVGDTGIIKSEKEQIMILNTIKENNLTIHISDKIPTDVTSVFNASVNKLNRELIANNHTATHLLHLALRKVLGQHVEQKGSLVDQDRLRFDFSHFTKLSKEELSSVEEIVNDLIRKNQNGKIYNDVPISDAKKMGAMALFGEKYGDKVRVVEFGDSVELCGGTHVKSTGEIGLFKIVSEGAIAAGVRRIEALTGKKSLDFIDEKLKIVDKITLMLKSTGDVTENVEKMMVENQLLKKTIEKLQIQSAISLRKELAEKAIVINGLKVISGILETESVEVLKNIANQFRSAGEDIVLTIGAAVEGRATLLVMVSDNLVKEKDINAINIIKQIAGDINGSGGGQPFLAIAGGKNTDGLGNALNKALSIIKKF